MRILQLLALAAFFGFSSALADTIELKTGERLEGYIFDRDASAARLRLMVKRGGKRAVSYSEISGLSFTGRDMADGRSWEAWVRKYAERKAAGESNIELVPEAID